MANLKTFIAKAASGEPLSRAEASAAFDVLEELTCPMSWGEAVLFVHRRSGDA